MQTSVIIGILFKILSDKKVITKDLAAHFEVSERTVFRYLSILEGAGIPIERTAGKQGGISIVDSYRLDRTFFTKEERLRIINSVKLASANYDDTLSDTITDKFLSLSYADNDDAYLLMTDTLVIDSSGWNNADIYRHKISAVNESISKNTVIKLKYMDRLDEVSERFVEPHTLVLKEGVFYLYAYCRLRGGFRMFKLARINTVTFTDMIFERRKLDNLPWNKPFPDDDSVNVTLEVNPGVLPDIEEWLGITAKEETGGLYTVRAKIPANQLSVRKIMSYGAEIKIIAPSSFADTVRQEYIKAAELYNKPL